MNARHLQQMGLAPSPVAPERWTALPALSHARFVVGACLLVFASLAGGVSGVGWEVEKKGDPDYATAVEALQREDWPRAVAALDKVITRRAWDDGAHTLLGFAHRKLGDYRNSLEHYRLALELNPYHRGALEYLGEADLEIGEHQRAKETLERLAAACRRVSKEQDSDHWKRQCSEWRELESLIRARGAD